MANKRTYPTSSLFVTIAVAALITRMLLTAVDLQDSPPVTVAIVALICGLAALVIGLAMGLHCYHRGRRAIAGAGLGFLIGAMLSPLIFVDKTRITEIAVLQLAGSAFLVVLAIFFWCVRSDPLERRDASDGPTMAALAEEKRR